MKDQFPCLSNNKACIEGQWDCGACEQEMKRIVWLSMSENRKRYDRMVDPQGVYTGGYSGGHSTECSCHINPPCGYCTSLKEDEIDV